MVEIKDGKLIIEVTLDSLAFAAKLCPSLEYYDEAKGEFREPKITDVEGFAKDVLRELVREEEDGTTLVHKMFDEAFLRAVEDGSEHIET